MSGSSSRRKGFNFERECVNRARSLGLEAERSWGSDGRSAGRPREVDMVIGGEVMQAKRVKKLSKRFTPAEHIYAQVFREDRGEALAVARFDDLLELLVTRGER